MLVAAFVCELDLLGLGCMRAVGRMMSCVIAISYIQRRVRDLQSMDSLALENRLGVQQSLAITPGKLFELLLGFVA